MNFPIAKINLCKKSVFYDIKNKLIYTYNIFDYSFLPQKKSYIFFDYTAPYIIEENCREFYSIILNTRGSRRLDKGLNLVKLVIPAS